MNDHLNCADDCVFCEEIRPKWRVGHVTRERNQGSIRAYNMVYGPAMMFVVVDPHVRLGGEHMVELRSNCCNGRLDFRAKFAKPGRFLFCDACFKATCYPEGIIPEANLDDLERVTGWASFCTDPFNAILIAADAVEMATRLLDEYESDLLTKSGNVPLTEAEG